MFKFKNISSEDMNVIIEEEEHFLAKAAQRVESTFIDGRDGELVEFYGYLNVERPIKVQILNSKKLDDIFAWLNGVGIFEYKDRITTAYFSQVIEPIRTSAIKVADFMFTRSPFWYKKIDEYEIVDTTIVNEGSIYSKPIIRLEKGTESIVDITIAGVRFKYDFKDDEYVEIDCEDMNAYYDNLLRNTQLEIGFKYPTLIVGTNDVIIHSGDPIIKVKRKDRWL